MSKKQKTGIILCVFVIAIVIGIIDYIYINQIVQLIKQDIPLERLPGINFLIPLFLEIIIILLIIIVIYFICMLEKMQNSVKRKEHLMIEAHHEIRAPLSSLIGIQQLIQQNIDNKVMLGRYIEEAEAVSDYLLSLINNILDLSKLEQGYIDLNQKPFSLEEMLHTVEIMMKKSVQEKQIHLEIQAEWIHTGIIGDELCLKQVLMNILGNAVKFTPDRGRIYIHVNQKVMGKKQIMTTFRIEDSGCGMSSSFRKHIFEAYTQERSPDSDTIRGTGLGMAISYHLMKKMGGEIHVSSKLNEGSCFTVKLPARMSGEVELLSGAALEPSVLVQKKQHVLVAEDDRLSANILMEILKSGGYQVSWAENGEKVIERFQNSLINEIDIILMDVKMPVMDGYETAKAVRALERPDAEKVRIYAHTAGTLERDKQKAEECGMNGVLVKPVRTQILFDILNQEEN